MPLKTHVSFRCTVPLSLSEFQKNRTLVKYKHALSRNKIYIFQRKWLILALQILSTADKQCKIPINIIWKRKKNSFSWKEYSISKVCISAASLCELPMWKILQKWLVLALQIFSTADRYCKFPTSPPPCSGKRKIFSPFPLSQKKKWQPNPPRKEYFYLLLLYLCWWVKK
jgi:hypothetical protein